MIRTIILLIFGGMLLLLAIRKLRLQRLKERYALLFVFTGMPFLVLAVWPDGIVYLSDKLAIEKPTLMVLILTAFVVLVLLQLLSIVSIQDRRIATLTQILSIVRHELREGEYPKNPGPAPTALDDPSSPRF